MKKIHIAASLLMVLFFMGTANSFVEKRLQWWEVRLKNLEVEKERVVKNTALDRRVLGIIEHEMNRGRDIMAVFQCEMRDDGSLTHEKKVVTESDIVSEAGTIVMPLFALHTLEALVDEKGNSASAAVVRNAVQLRLSGLIQLIFATKSPELVQKVMNEEISRDEWKNLSLEYFIGCVMSSYKTDTDHAVADITARASQALKSSNNRTNTRELRLLLVKLTKEYLGECNSRMSSNASTAALEASWTWKRKESHLSRDFNACKKIMAMVKNPASVSLERIIYFHKNPADLDSLLFKGQHPQETNTQSVIKHADAKNGSLIMEIPAPLRMENILDEIDRLRRGTVPTLTGREDQTFFNDIEKHFTAAISRHTAGVKKSFSREEERIQLLRKKDGESLRISNEKDFIEAKNNFHSSLSFLEGYRNKSLEYLTLVSDGKSINSSSIVDQYSYRLQRDHEYLQFAAGLVAETSRLWSVDDPRIHKHFSISLSRLNSLFNFIGTSLNLERNDQTHLIKRDLSAIRNLKTRFIGTVNSLRSDIRNSYTYYSRKRVSAAGAEKKNRESLQETIAQDEIDGLYRHVGECVELFEFFQYGEKELYRYAEQFKIFMKEARTGSPSKALEYSLTMNSIFASLENFESSRVTRESATKKYLQNEAKTSLARLAALLDFYKKNKVSFKDAPTPADIATLGGRLASAPQIKIDSWLMNENNFSEIDKKAVKKLSLVLSRKELVPDGNKHAHENKQNDTRVIITIKDPELSLAFPRGWEEESIGETETFMGIVKSLHSSDGNSSVRLVRLPIEKDDMKNTAEGWIQKSGCTLVEKRWEKTGDLSYLWILSKDKNKNIYETCSVSKDGYTVLITGKNQQGPVHEIQNTV